MSIISAPHIMASGGVNNIIKPKYQALEGQFRDKMLVALSKIIVGNTQATFSFHALISVPAISLVVFVFSFVTAFLVQKIPFVGKYLA